jgi:hypothetical protein
MILNMGQVCTCDLGADFAKESYVNKPSERFK